MSEPFARPHSGPELMDVGTFSELCSRMARRAARGRADAQAPATRPAQPRVVDLAELGARVLNDPAAARAVSDSAPAGTSDAPICPAPALEVEIDRARSRDAVAHLSVRLARCYASAAALFVVHRGIIRGVSGDGLQGRAEAILFPAGAESVFAEVASSGAAFRGGPPADGLDHRILRALGRDRVEEIAVLPIALRGRVVSLLYADNGPAALGDATAAALTTVCARVGAAWERLIRESRRRARIRL
jgi:hypothetical protein